jgi:isopentenyl-diphosphate delta-isomerase
MTPPSPNTDNVILVNNNDQPIGTMDKIQAHILGVLHRAFSVFIFDTLYTPSRLVLQKRAATKYHCAGLWTNTCCSHPRMHETVLDAGHRRLAEEMNLSIPLIHQGHFVYKAVCPNGLIEHEFDHVLVGQSDNTQCIPNPTEVSEVRWESLPIIHQELASMPHIYSPWFAQALHIALNGNQCSDI